MTTPLRARAVLLGDRIAVDRSAHADIISLTPYGFRKGWGFAVLFRYGAAVLIGLDPAAEAQVLAELAAHGAPAEPIEEEQLGISLAPGREEALVPNDGLRLAELSPDRALVLADILAKSVALARYEREIAQVFDTIEPLARAMAATGATPKDRRALRRLVGSALLVQHRVSGRIAFAEKPEVLWEHPELERLYVRLEDEYEIGERGALLAGKLGVIAAAAQTFTDLMDTERSARLELLVVLLILAELVVGAAALFR